MVIEEIKNRDLFLKFSFMNFLNYMLIALGINEEIVEIESNEGIYFNIIVQEFSGFFKLEMNCTFKSDC